MTRYRVVCADGSRYASDAMTRREAYAQAARCDRYQEFNVRCGPHRVEEVDEP